MRPRPKTFDVLDDSIPPIAPYNPKLDGPPSTGYLLVVTVVYGDEFPFKVDCHSCMSEPLEGPTLESIALMVKTHIGEHEEQRELERIADA